MWELGSAGRGGGEKRSWEGGWILGSGAGAWGLGLGRGRGLTCENWGRGKSIGVGSRQSGVGDCIFAMRVRESGRE